MEGRAAQPLASGLVLLPVGKTGHAEGLWMFADAFMKHKSSLVRSPMMISEMATGLQYPALHQSGSS